jgi:hypothetical protein
MSYAQGSPGDPKPTGPLLFRFSAAEVFTALLKSAALAYVTVEGDAFTIELSAPPYFYS